MIVILFYFNYTESKNVFISKQFVRKSQLGNNNKNRSILHLLERTKTSIQADILKKSTMASTVLSGATECNI